jgi:hypothetical protein
MGDDMDQSNKASAAKLSATIQEIQSYPKYIKPSIFTTPPPSMDASLDNLVKTGKLTQAQANQVKLCNPTSMFGTLLDMMQNPDGNTSTDSTLSADGTAPASTDPFSILMDAFKAEDNTKTSGDPLYDTLAGLMPAYDQYGRPAATAAPATPSAASGASTGKKDSTVRAKVADLLPNIKA